MFNGRLVFAAALCAALAVGSVAYAAIPSTTDGVISSCYDAAGNVRVIDAQAGQKCPAGTTALSWNQRGRTGPTGPAGAQGQPGPAYFARVATTDNQTSKPGNTLIQTWSYSDGIWLYLPNIDVRNCAVNATALTSQTGALVTRADLTYDHWIFLYTNLNGSRSRYPVDVTIACPSTDNPWSASY
jgi:hypothetical protein